jgi:TnpA family transposase
VSAGEGPALGGYAIRPTYQAMIEVGRTQRTIFARYLRNRDLQPQP